MISKRCTIQTQIVEEQRSRPQTRISGDTMPEAIRKINVIGHLHPDTDSICSAISYAYLKNQIDEPIYEARRAGMINRETAFVLNHFGFKEPELITTVTPQIKDIQIQHSPAIDGEMSLFAAWNLMQKTKIDTLCITDDAKNLQGIIAVKDIANANMDIFDNDSLAAAHTKYANVVSTLNGKLILGDADARIEKGSVSVGTTPELMEESVHEGDIVLVTNRFETQMFAVEIHVSCIVVCAGAHISEVVKKAAAERGITVISTPYETYAAARLISMSLPVRSRMLTDGILRFSVDTSVDEARKVITQSRHRFFPVLDENGHYVGVVSVPNLLDIKRKHVILVDHNERAQAVNGLEEAVITEIIDHHRIGTIETSQPAYFRNEPVGCTCTILYSIYQEHGVEIPKNIAGLMMSAILSDTLMFRSPTCTEKDRHAGRALAKICGEDIESYADAMFDAGADVSGRTAEEIFNSDFKVFSRGQAKFGVGQGVFMTDNSRKAAEALVGPYLKEACADQELPIIFYMFTDAKSQATELLYHGRGAEDIIRRAFGVEPKNGVALLPGIVSRKKQMIPPIMAAYQNLEESE
jgi:manganese-dependent inorganic pyrophosphatase